jgi:hypothetical protein
VARQSRWTLVFAHGERVIAWHPGLDKWLVKGGGVFSFKDLRAVQSDNSAENGCPKTITRCQQLVETIRAAGKSQPLLRKEEWQPHVVHDFMVALWKLGLPRQVAVFNNERNKGNFFIADWVAHLPAWADSHPAVPRGSADHAKWFDTFLNDTHPYSIESLRASLREPGAVVEIVGPPGSGKSALFRDLIGGYRDSEEARPFYFTHPHPLDEFFLRFAQRLAEHPYDIKPTEDDPGRIAEGLSQTDQLRPVVLVLSAKDYFGISLEQDNNRRLVKNWLGGLRELCVHGQVSILLASTVPIAHQVTAFDDLSMPLKPETVSVSSSEWETWIEDLRGRWEARSPSVVLPWDEVDAQAWRQRDALIHYVQQCHRKQAALPVSELSEIFDLSAREIPNRLPACCTQSLVALINGGLGSASCISALLLAGILRQQGEEFGPMVPRWAETWKRRWVTGA